MRTGFGILFTFFWIVSYAQKSDFSHINFQKADSISRTCSSMSLKNMPLLVHQLTNDLDTQVEKFRAIHTWVCLNIESDHYFSEITLKKRKQLQANRLALHKWNAKAQAKVFKRLVRSKKTICTGYAYVLKTLANLVDIECEIVDGYARTTTANINIVGVPNHSWNVVKLNNKWYLADTTQASGYYNLDENQFVKDYNEGYFLARPQLFVKNHYPIEQNWLLLDESISIKAYVKAPIIYGETYKYGIIPQTPELLVTEVLVGDTLEFLFEVEDETLIKDINLVITGGFGYRKLQPQNTSYSNGQLALTYLFNRKGHFDVHAKIGEDIVASYTLKVSKASNWKTEDM
ncbi:MAG: transglutaminase domain-containing protein [Jejuia sp.]